MTAPRRTAQDMDAVDNALFYATQMASLTVEFMGRAVGFDDISKDPVSEEDRELLSFAVLQTKVMINRARDLFVNGEEDKGQ